jgi:hypothetical protein
MNQLIELSSADNPHDLGQFSIPTKWSELLDTLPSWTVLVAGGLAVVGLITVITSITKAVSRSHSLDGLGDLGIIKRCRKLDLTPKKARKDQRWCLWDAKGEKIIGRHPSRSRALRQEHVIQLKKRGLL